MVVGPALAFGGRSTNVSILPFDPENPPEEPPESCADRLTWRLAYALHAAHQPNTDGFCDCRQFYPCPASKLAAQGLRSACGIFESMSMATAMELSSTDDDPADDLLVGGVPGEEVLVGAED
jgi:hypothetical protein